MNPREHALRTRVRVRGMGAVNLRRRGYVYNNYYDFLLSEGEFYRPVPRPPQIPVMLPRKCFFNALLVAIVHEIPYVEGMAVSPHDNGEHHHAWNLDEAGNAIDTTWGIGRAYLGVPFSAARANEATWDGDASVLQDDARGWALLRSQWRGERSPGDTGGLLEKMAQDMLNEPGEPLPVSTVDELVDAYRRLALAS